MDAVAELLLGDRNLCICSTSDLNKKISIHLRFTDNLDEKQISIIVKQIR